MTKSMRLIAVALLAAGGAAHAQTGPQSGPQTPSTVPPPTIYTPKAAETPPARLEAAASRDAPVNGVLFLYGDKEKCPVDSNGNETVVCVRRPAGERFRIPKEIRPESIKPEYQSWANRTDDILESAGSGLNSCSPVGAGGQVGCSAQNFRRARRENQARKEAEAANTPQ